MPDILTKEEAIERLNDGDSVTFVCEEGHEYEVESASAYVGGGDGYTSVVLGNVEYETAEDAITATIDYFKKDGISFTIKETE